MLQLIQQAYMYSQSLPSETAAVQAASEAAAEYLHGLRDQQTGKQTDLAKQLQQAKFPGQQAKSPEQQAKLPEQPSQQVLASRGKSAGHAACFEVIKSALKTLAIAHQLSHEVRSDQVPLDEAGKTRLRLFVFGHCTPEQALETERGLARTVRAELERLAGQEVPQDLPKAEQRNFKKGRAEVRQLLEQHFAAGEAITKALSC